MFNQRHFSLNIFISCAAVMFVLGMPRAVLPAAADGKTPPPNDANHSLPTEAVAVLTPTEGSDVKGTILLQQKEGYVHLTGKVAGLDPGKHGFHIHEFGDLRGPQGKSAGGHFNPTGERHGKPGDPKHHVGDLGNIIANSQGIAMVNKKAKGLKLHFVVGRSIVVHDEADDFTSQPSGDAGPRMAVGVIGIAPRKKQ